MRKINFLLLALALVGLSSCSVITGIFKAGVVVGILIVVVIVALIIWLISAIMK
jgi:hypothetical protein